MDLLIKSFTRILNALPNHHRRYLYDSIDWEGRLIGLTGARGTGKTTLLLQYIKDNFPQKEKVLYVSLDNIWFTKNSLLDLADKFDAYGGKYLFLDEVHRYPNWAIELKNIYDSFPEMYVVFTGSSMLEIYKSNADLSRRAICYELKGLSFREFLLLEHKIDFPVFVLNEILEKHQTIASDIIAKIKILPAFKNYLRYGYYPIFREGLKSYPNRVHNAINSVLDNDLPSIEHIEYTTIFKIKKLLMLLASLVPYSPNINALSNEIESSRAHTLRYLEYLRKAAMIQTYLYPKKSMKMLSKPDKIYLNNSNLLYILTNENANIGNVRETFFANQVSAKYTVNTAKRGDFEVGEFVFEVGGSSKKYKQIADIPNSYLVVDETEVGYGNKIPLWLFGFLY
ncbi:MAG: AAA family ATPase [Prevotellaceae bacterium]|jgi:predicted AAA+ superfamily ATPase|nr:AAA family ATPase [Prevotellaceae bacterium]